MDSSAPAHPPDTNDEYLIEELNSNDVPEAELSEFQETQPLKVVDIIDIKQEGALIKKFVRGEIGELPDMYTKLEPEEDEDADTLEEGYNKLAQSQSSVHNDVDMEKREEQLKKQEVVDLPTTSQSANANRQRQQHDGDVEDTNATPQLELPEEHNRGGGGYNSGGTIRKRTVLSAALQGLMGEANLCYARGQVEMAEKICLEIIRQNPLASEPFFTLAEIYETRDPQKYLNFLTLAAHLNPHDREQWIRIAEMHISQGNLQIARSYFTKAIKVLHKDYDLRFRKAQLLELMGETNAAMVAYLRMIPLVPLQEANLCLATAKNVARHFHGLGKHHIAMEAMQNAYTVCAHLFTLEDLNLYMELLILNKCYAKVLSCLRERTNLELETEKEHNLELVFFCVIPDDFVPDFRAKLCVSLIHLRAHHLLGYLIRNVHEHIPLADDRLDLYIDVAEALMQENKYAEAISLLSPITDGDTVECPAFVWLRQAECLRHLNRTSEAIESFARVVELAPFCYEAKFTLSALLKQQGRHLEAIKALEQAEVEADGQPLNARLLYERCVMLQQIGEMDEFLEVGDALLGRRSIRMRNREEMIAVANGGSFYNAEGLKVILQMRNIAEDTEKALQEYNKPNAQDNSDLSIHDEYKLFVELVRTAFAHRRFAYIERLCFAMVTTKRFVGVHIELERIIILACYFNNDCTIAFSYLRELISKTPSHIMLWNLLSLFVQKGQDLRYNRYTRRLLQRQTCPRQVRLFLAHYHLHSCSFKYALNIYAPLFKEHQDPLTALCISVIFNQLSSQKKVLRKSAALAQAICFAQKYAELRRGGSEDNDNRDQVSDCAAEQEICYNIGRIYHQSGLTHLALEYYERGLRASHPLIDANKAYLSLREEIAFNMHLIYRASGNTQKARQYLYQYCIV